MKLISNPADASPRASMASLSLAMLLGSLGTSVANVALPELSRQFAAPFQQVQWVVLAYLLAVTATIVVAGRLGDLMGRRRLLLLGLALYGGASLLAAFASFGGLVAARAVQGAGAAVMMALSMAFVADVAPSQGAGRAMGWLGTMSAVGTALGPSLGGALIAVFGWRSIFLLLAASGGGAFWLGWRCLPAGDDSARGGVAGFDLPGAALLALAVSAYAWSMTAGHGRFGALNAAWLALALAGGCAFIWWERRASAPLLRLDMLRDPVLSGGMAMSGLVAAVMMATFVVGPFYLALAQGLDSAAVGLAMSAGPLVSALSGVPAGLAVDRYGAAWMMRAGLAAMLAGAAALSLTPMAWGVPGYIASLLLLTVGYAQFQAANNTQVMAGSGADRRGLVAGLLNLARNLGLVSGAAAMGAVFSAAVGARVLTAAAPEAVASGMHVVFAAAAGLIALALAVSWGGTFLAARAMLAGMGEREG